MKLDTNNQKALANKKVLMASLNLFKKWERNIEIKRITNEILGVEGLKILFGIDILSISPFYSFRHKSAV